MNLLGLLDEIEEILKDVSVPPAFEGITYFSLQCLFDDDFGR